MTFKRIISIAFVALITSVSFSSCMKEKLELQYSQQDEAIDKYVENQLNKNNNLSVTYNNGVCRLTTVQGKGESLKEHGTVSFYFAGYLFNGNIKSDKGELSPVGLFCTNHEGTATKAQWILNEDELKALTICLNDTDFIDGLKKGLYGVRAGEECEIIFSGKYGFGNKPFGIIPANSPLFYKIWVKSISNE